MKSEIFLIIDKQKMMSVCADPSVHVMIREPQINAIKNIVNDSDNPLEKVLLTFAYLLAWEESIRNEHLY